MLSSMKRILNESKVLIIKMVEKNVVNEMAKTNYKLICDVQTLWAWLVCCPYCNQYMDSQNSLKGMGLLFITLLVLCSLLKHMSF
jgi:hypothetical protein